MDPRKQLRRFEKLESRNMLTGEISGLVWVDSNADGARDPSEQGLTETTVFVDVNNNGNLDASEPSASTQSDNPATQQDESGRYRLTDLEVGDHVVRVLHELNLVQSFLSAAMISRSAIPAPC